ncbi:MAG: DUF1700 domain-containing protein [Lachnospiraceae bacterium]|nr:DUF1700 domain-containing protein [Lachnospiraceae bacterium]
MNREDYLKALDKYLKRLPQKEYENAVGYFREYFEDAGEENEQEVIRELGTPKEAAAEVLRNLLTESSKELQQEETKKSHIGKNIRLAVLAVLAAPIGLPLAVAAIAVLLSVVLTVAAMVVCVFAFSLTLFCVGGKLLLRGLVALPVSVPGAMLLCGLGILAIGCGLLSVILAVYLTKWLSAGVVMFSRKVIRKRRK